MRSRKRILLHASKKLTPFSPINPDRNRLRASRTKERLQQRHRFTGRNCHRSLPGEEIGDALIARDITFAAEHAPVHRQRGKAERLTMMREAIDESIRRAVISLRRIAENARDRREHDEAIEIHFPRCFVQQPCAVRLGSENGSHALGRERRERRIVDHHREMKDDRAAAVRRI